MANRTTISKVRTKNAKRTLRSRIQDLSKSAKKVVSPKNHKGLRAWMKNPGKVDVRGVDTKRKRKK